MGVIGERSSINLVENLLLKGLNPNEAIENGPDEGCNCLMMAAANGKTNLVRLLVKYEADVNLKAKDGQTGLCLAEENGMDSMIKFLKSPGAK